MLMERVLLAVLRHRYSGTSNANLVAWNVICPYACFVCFVIYFYSTSTCCPKHNNSVLFCFLLLHF